jgi:hypothetical protein
MEQKMTVNTQAAVKSDRKPYKKPVMTKGPLLNNITAIPAGSAKLGCWIAQAAFGRDDIRWMIFREWMLDDSPRWFHDLYIRFGERVGAWLETRDTARAVVRYLMMLAVRRKICE